MERKSTAGHLDFCKIDFSNLSKTGKRKIYYAFIAPVLSKAMCFSLFSCYTMINTHMYTFSVC